jgi:hypothetical protein
LGIKEPRREGEHPPPASAEDKNMWSYTSTSPYVFMARRSIKQRDNRIFAFSCRSVDEYSDGETNQYIRVTFSGLTGISD